jgi:hypothetical protein
LLNLSLWRSNLPLRHLKNREMVMAYTTAISSFCVPA